MFSDSNVKIFDFKENDSEVEEKDLIVCLDDEIYEFDGLVVDLYRGVMGMIDDLILSDTKLKIVGDSIGLKGRDEYIGYVLSCIESEIEEVGNDGRFDGVDWKEIYGDKRFNKRSVEVVEDLVYGRWNLKISNIWINEFEYGELYEEVDEEYKHEEGNYFSRNNVLDKLYNVRMGGGDIRQRKLDFKNLSQ